MPYLGKTPSQATRQRYYKTASGGETSISGTMTTGGTLTFTDGEFVDVSVNGVALVAGTDYNTTTANTIGGLSALTANDQVEIVVYDTFSVFGGNVDADFNINNGNLSVSGTSTLTGNVSLPDNTSLIFGAGTDLTINHDGSNSFITDSGTGALYIQGTNGVFIRSADGGENLASFTDDGSVELYHNNTKRIETTSVGVGVDQLFGLSDTDTGIALGANGANIMQFYTANNERLRIAADGKVGVNTSAANLQMSVNFDTSAVAGFGLHDTNSGNLGGMLQFYSGSGQGTLRANIMNANNDGVHFAVGNGSVVFTQNSYVSANALDDYEEGDWTPDIRESGSQVGDAAYNTSFTAGQYTKVGRIVHMTCSIRLTSKGSPTSSNNFQIGGLPFTSTNNIKARTAVSLFDHVGAGFDTTGNTNGTLMGLLSHNADEITFRVTDVSGTTGEAVNYDDIGDTLYLQLAFSFITG